MKAWLSDLESGDEHRAEAAAKALAQEGEKAIPPLKKRLQSEEEDVRWWALRALAEIDAPEIPSLLQEHLHDTDTAVRQCAALGLRLQPTPAAVKDLLALLDDDDRLLARLAGDALIAVGEPAVEPLLGVMREGAQRARVEAVRALAEIGDTRAVSDFFYAIQEGDSTMVEYWADRGLTNMGIGMSFFKP